MQWNLSTILILVVVLFIGYGFGLLENYLKYSRKLKQVEQEKLAAQADQELRSVVPRSEPNLLRLWADPAQTLNLELDGVRVESPAAASTEQRRRLITLLTQIRPWLEAAPTAPASVPVERPAEAPPIAVQNKTVTDRPAKTALASSPAPVLKSIVAQIDDVLQIRLAGTPLATKGIRLVETPSGGVLVHVGANSYEGIDLVPDAEATAAIRAAIAEWEKKKD